MKRIVIILTLVLSSFGLNAQTKVRFMPQWFAQAQFAGYYVAYEKGFYEEEGLDVDIIHINNTSSSNVISHVENGEVDIFTNQLISSMIAQSKYGNIQNILQTAPNSGLMCVSHTPIKSFSDLNGKKVGRWRAGFAEVAEMFCGDFNVDVEWVYSIQANNLFIADAIDAMLCYSFSEYLSLLFSLGRIDDENKISFSDLGYNFPEDGLYTTSEFAKDNPEVIDKFVRASIKGWKYAAENEEQTLDIVMKYIRDNNIVSNRAMQKQMLREVLRLQKNADTGIADFAKIEKDTFYMLNDYLISLGYIQGPIDFETFVR